MGMSTAVLVGSIAYTETKLLLTSRDVGASVSHG